MEEAERRKVAEKKKKKRRMLEYLQQLQDNVLEEDTILLKGTEGFQIMGSKCKETLLENNTDCQPFKKAKEKQLARYQEDIRIQLGGANPYERYVYAGQDCLVHNSR